MSRASAAVDGPADGSDDPQDDDTEPLAISAHGVRKAFGDDGILQGVDLTVREGEIVVLLGPNGVGKSVLLSALAGSTTPTEGSVEVFGQPVAEDGGSSLSYLRQEAMAIDTLSGRENAAFYSRLHPAFTDRWREYVDAMGLTPDLDKLVTHYSSGMTRKLELALAMSVDVPLYLLDEPTAGVDPSMIQTFHDVILDQYDRGKTFVITSHRPMDADLADRLAFVREGRVTTTGRPDDLLDSVPKVVRATGTAAARALEAHVVDGRLFHVGSEARGFLAPGSSVAAVEEAVAEAGADGRVTPSEPTYTDLFNYYVHVADVDDSR